MSAPVWEITREMFLSEEEIESLLSHLCKREQLAEGRNWLRARTDRVIVEALLYSGLRNSEFCRLQVGQTAVGLGDSVFDVCSANPRRIVHVPRHVSRLLGEYARDVRPHWLPEGVNPNDQKLPLIVNERGNGYDRTALYRRVVRALTEAGLGSRASVQLLRHTYGYLAYKRTGGNLLFVQRQLGHAHPMVTAVYAQFVEEPYAAMADAIAQDYENYAAKRRSRLSPTERRS